MQILFYFIIIFFYLLFIVMYRETYFVAKIKSFVLFTGIPLLINGWVRIPDMIFRI